MNDLTLASSSGPRRYWRWHFEINLNGTKNAREHHHAKGRRVKRERHDTHYTSIAALGSRWFDAVRFPVEIQITRYGPKTLDRDNLGESTSAVQDEVIEMLKGSPGGAKLTDSPDESRVDIKPTMQRKGPFGVEIEIHCVEAVL